MVPIQISCQTDQHQRRTKRKRWTAQWNLILWRDSLRDQHRNFILHPSPSILVCLIWDFDTDSARGSTNCPLNLKRFHHINALALHRKIRLWTCFRRVFTMLHFFTNNLFNMNAIPLISTVSHCALLFRSPPHRKFEIRWVFIYERDSQTGLQKSLKFAKYKRL